MKQYKEETTPVQYGPAAVKRLQFRVEPNKSGMYIHWHDRMELIRVREGELVVGCDAATQVLCEGGIYIVPPKVPHFAAGRDAGAVYEVLMFDVRSFYNDTDLCRNFLEPLFDGRAKMQQCTDRPEVTEAFDRVFETAQDADFEVISLVYRLLALLFRYTLMEISGDVKGRNIVIQATEYMKANLAEEITTKSLARQFGYSQEHFCRLFKDVTRVTPMQYLKVFRLERAMHLLNENKYSISEISELCGFADPNYFTRCFKAFFGTTPTQMQK